MNGTNSLENYKLRPIFEEIQLAQAVFNTLSFQHVYNERNMEDDGLSKAGLHSKARAWIIKERVKGYFME
jgi:hypothetical protein